nr:DNA topoisomerase 2 [Onthophagus taurus]
MADLKSMFAKMGTSMDTSMGENGVSNSTASKKAVPKQQSIEQTYQKKSQLEHILLRPDTYIGSVEKAHETMYIYDGEKDRIIQKQIEYVPGLYKIFDEILVNAADNKQRDPKMDCIKVDINPETNTISVWNNGKGIPVVMHKDEQTYVPSMIFGQLLTSSNYNDEEEKVTGGRNGYGAKLCNIFSTKFIVETACMEYKKQFKQTWASNMMKTSDAKIKDFRGDDFTKITFCPDLVKFKMDSLDEGIVGLMSRRAYDVAASSRGVKVFLNGKRLPVKSFKDYIDLFIKESEDEMGNPLKVIYENVSDRWEVGITMSDKGFQQMSFVNSIATTKGGRHVDYVTEMITKQLIEVVKKKNKGGVNIKPFQIKNHMWIFINCLIVNPTFDSQTKENMTSQIKSFGSKCTLSEKFINAVTKSGIIESVLSWAKFKEQKELSKAGGKKQAKLKGIPKLEDANQAGTKNALKCTLILTEGDSAKSLAVSGLGVIGRDYYGVFPLRGKLLNVREATHKQILENAEINNLIKILGLQYKKKYNTDDDMKSLRYGKVMIMTDQDQDGSHIKGLLINFIHFNWPELLRRDFLEEFITPIVKATKKGQELSFYSIPEFDEWKSNTANHHTFNIKYYKGLGTSTSKEAKEYFTNMTRHRIRFRYNGQTDDDHIILAFSKKHVEHRKEWLTNFMTDSKRRKEMGMPERYLYGKDTRAVTYADFVNLELVLFSNADNIRSIPSLVDGLKPGQRKVIYTCIKRNDKKEVKVAQLAGSVAEQSAYHHGEVSLCMTIVNLAQNFVGSNNINLLEPRGQFGTRLAGGKDSASPRYIFTKMSPLTRLLFHPHDDALLKYEYDDNLKIEPYWYIPIIPMVLVNGAEGIGTGWMTKIPNYNPREIVANLRLLLNNEEPVPMLPWYKNFRGMVEDCGDSRFIVSGEIAVIGNDTLEITELPIGTWTQNYKENVLESLLHGSEKVKALIQDYKEYNTDTTIKFVVTCLPGGLQQMEKDGLHKIFKLQSIVGTTSMCAFDEAGCLKKYETVLEMLREFYTLRLAYYLKRKEYLEGMLGAEADKLNNQARFIMEKCSGELVVENKKRKTIVDELIRRNYSPDPVKEWKKRMTDEEEEAGEGDEETEEQEETEALAKPSKSSSKPIDPEKAFKNLTDVKKFDYLLGMSMWMLTEERKNDLLRQRDVKITELDILKKKTPAHLWREDLDAFMEKLDAVEEKERKDELGDVAKIKESKSKNVLGKKKINLLEVLPSPKGRRVVPEITEEIKKKIQTAVKTKEQRAKKGVKKEESIDDEKDEFDLMVQDKKTLTEKIGVTDEDKKKKGGRGRKGKADGMKQTKLDFKKSDKANGSPKKRGKKYTSDSENDDIGSDSDLENLRMKSPPPPKERQLTRRAATKSVKYDLDSDVSDDVDDEPVFHDNVAVKEELEIERVANLSSDSESEAPPARSNVSSEDLFDSLVGRKQLDKGPQQPEPETTEISVPPVKRQNKRKKKDLSDSEDKPKKLQKMDVVDSDSDVPIAKKKKAPQKKKPAQSDDESKKGGKKKKKNVEDDDDSGDDYSPPPKNVREGRVKNPVKYVLSSDSD